MSEKNRTDSDSEKVVKRLRVRRDNIRNEMGSDLGQQKIRRKRKRVKESRDPEFRKDGKTEQDVFDPETSAAEREEDAWSGEGERKRKKLSRKQTIICCAVGVLLLSGTIFGLVYRGEDEAPSKESVAERIFQQEEQAEKKMNTPVKDPKIAIEQSKAESLAKKLPRLRKTTLDLLAKLDVAKSVEELKKITRDYPAREADLRRWLDNTPKAKRPRSKGVFMTPIVTGGEVCVQLLGELRDYSYFVSYLVEEEDGRWVLDWESFVAKSDIPISDLRKSGATSELGIRGMVEVGDFYTPPVINDKDYTCYLVRNLNEVEYLWVYTPRGGSMDKTLRRQITGEFQGLDDANNTVPSERGTMRAFRLRIRPLYGAVLKSQFELVKIQGHGWLDPHEQAVDE